MARDRGRAFDPPFRLEPPKQHENENNDKDEADDADATMPEAVAVAAKTATEPAEQKNDEKDNEDGSDRHGVIFLPRNWLNIELRGQTDFEASPRTVCARCGIIGVDAMGDPPAPGPDFANARLR
jgi:hypothetical protein